MESSKLYIEIENVIRNNLQCAYNKNLPKVNFNLLNSFPDFKEAIEFNNFSIDCTSSEMANLKLSQWRIPQTRIYFSELKGLELKVSELQYFNVSIILVKNYRSLETQFNFNSNEPVYNVINNSSIKDQIVIAGNEEYVLYTGKSKYKSDELITYLTQSIAEEKSCNPINKIFSKDISLLKSIDAYWANIPWKAKDQVVKDKKRDSHIDDAISLILSELSMYVDFKYDSFPRKKLDSKEIQAFWNIISLPAFKYKLINLIRLNPVKVISFLLAAYVGNFWWADKAKILIHGIFKSYIQNIEALFILLFTLKSNFNVAIDEDKISVSYFHQDSFDTIHTISTDVCQAKFVQSKRETLTYATFADLDTISINKKARINYHPKNKIEISPQTYQYSLNLNNPLIVNINTLQLQLAPVWKDFVISIGSLRLKFLFKKNRYQVSLKGNSKIENFNINGDSFSFKESKYIKTYYSPPCDQMQYQIYYTDENGRTIDGQNTLNPIGLNAIAQNKYGHIIENLHLRKRSLKKNIALNKIGTTINNLNATESYDLIVPKSGSAPIDMVYTESFLTKILYTDSSILEEQLCIFIKNQNQLKSIKERFYYVFGYYASLKSFSDLNKSFGTINLVVDDKSQSGDINSFPFYKEVSLKQNGQKKALSFTHENFLKWLEALIVA